MTVDRRTFVAGTTLLAFASALEFLPATNFAACSKRRPPRFHDRRLERPK